MFSCLKKQEERYVDYSNKVLVLQNTQLEKSQVKEKYRHYINTRVYSLISFIELQTFRKIERMWKNIGQLYKYLGMHAISQNR